MKYSLIKMVHHHHPFTNKPIPLFLVFFLLLSMSATECHARTCKNPKKQEDPKNSDFRNLIPPKKMIRECAQMSRVAYNNLAGKEKFKHRWGLWPKDYQVQGFINSNDGTQVWLLKNKNDGIPTIVFRGSD